MKKYEKLKIVGIIGILANLFLFIIKLISGLFFKSQSMIADSFNSISDVFASLMTFIGNKIASYKKDEDHNFGHEKAEHIFSMYISISIFVISIKLLYDSFSSLILSHKVTFSWYLVIVSVVTILIKLGLFLYTKNISKKESSLLLKSNMVDHRNDMILTTSVLISVIFSKFHIYFVDGIVGIFISVCFFITGVKIFKESFNVLMNSSLNLSVKDELVKLVLELDDILGVEEISSLSIGYKYIVILTIKVDGNLNTFKSHAIANYAEKNIKKKFKDIEEVFIHIHPVKIS